MTEPVSVSLSELQHKQAIITNINYALKKTVAADSAPCALSTAPDSDTQLCLMHQSIDFCKESSKEAAPPGRAERAKKCAELNTRSVHPSFTHGQAGRAVPLVHTALTTRRR